MLCPLRGLRSALLICFLILSLERHIFVLFLPQKKQWTSISQNLWKKRIYQAIHNPQDYSLFKKKRGLRPCSDYHGNNHITVKYHYLLFLMLSVLEQLISIVIFTKLCLHRVYNDQYKQRRSVSHFDYLIMSYGLFKAPPLCSSWWHGDIFWLFTEPHTTWCSANTQSLAKTPSQ